MQIEDTNPKVAYTVHHESTQHESSSFVMDSQSESWFEPTEGYFTRKPPQKHKHRPPDMTQGQRHRPERPRHKNRPRNRLRGSRNWKSTTTPDSQLITMQDDDVISSPKPANSPPQQIVYGCFGDIIHFQVFE